ncbi:MAG: single-stranded DNA-binding protein [Deltaproteobacteria bacterium]|nr:single-stranded DNA-binding protein [Deltaproteobacteria bacterium]MCB9789300.1 single-stranded DNA-binding protein [Deltaproteobacteria bacterium]
MDLEQITDHLVAELAPLSFAQPVTHVYNPLVYARAAWDLYCRKYGQGPREVLMLGMNPGPFGMGQVGVPFGEVGHVRDWLGIEAPIGKPPVEHPKRPIKGFECSRSEVSGARLWGWAREGFGTPEVFFARFFVTNYCPLVFMEESGRNRVPEKLPKAEKEPLFAACDRALRRSIEHFAPRYVIGVGKFAEAKAREVAGDLDLVIGAIPHPSPASPLANRGWAPLVDAALERIGVTR